MTSMTNDHLSDAGDLLFHFAIWTVTPLIGRCEIRSNDIDFLCQFAN